MSFLSRMFSTSEPSPSQMEGGFLKVDMHSHLLPGIDDGVKDFAESILVIRNLYDMGYRKLITTPHVMSDFYRNTPEEIRALCEELRHELTKANIDMAVDCAAEYYLDDHFEEELKNKNLLYFGDKYVLVETSYLNPTNNFFELVFNLKMAGYQPVLAHPERYVYLHNDWEKYKDIFAREMFFALNLASLVGYYSKESKKIAERLIKEKMVHFVGTDIHNTKLLPHFSNALKAPSYKALEPLKLLNNSLLKY